MENLLKNLNKEQVRAVTHKAGPLLIIAGAGTGKTTVITRKIAYIIAKKWAKPSEILALTFTEKAAQEMEARVDELVPYGFVDMWISTFHAFGDRLLRDYSLDLGLPVNFKVLTKTQQAIFLRENIYAFDLKHFRPVANPTSYIDELLKHFSRLKDELITPEEYIDYAQSQISKFKSQDEEELLEAEKTLELANAYQRYQDLMIQAGNLDFGDQIFLTYKLLKENKKVLKECQQKFKYILVDEFQDTNYAQNEIVKLLAGKSGNITVVGDDDQAIYRFRGASVSNILQFEKNYPQTKKIVLRQNYRSTQEILDSAYKLIQHNNPDRLEVRNKIDKRLVGLKHGPRPELIHCDTLSCEADKVVETIKKLKSEGYSNNDFAILVRANSHAEPFIQALNQNEIPSVFSGASRLFAEPEVKMLIAFFRCLVYPSDNLSFYQLATSEIYNLPSELLAKFYEKARYGNRSFIEIVENDGQNSSAKIMEVVKDIKKYRELIKNKRAGELLYEFIKEKKLLKKYLDQPTVENEIKIQNIAKFFERLAQFESAATDCSVLAYLENLELILEVGEESEVSDIDPELNAVNVLTVHAAKGLEWPVVFVVNMVDQRFPTCKKREQLPIPDKLIKEILPAGDYHLQEERRLFYVAVTRAKDHLFLSAADDYGGKRARKLSQFVLELLDEPQLGKIRYKLSALEKIRRFERQSAVASIQPSSLALKDTGDQKPAILKLSRQQIDDYYTCPKKFYFASVIKIPLPTDWHFMYGSAIHSAISQYYLRKISGMKPTLKSLIADFEANFTNEGFITREQEEERKRTGIETLRRFFDEDQKINLIPDKVEDRFEFSEDFVKVSGRYDLVKKGKSGVEICDFKTSQVRDQKDADRRIKESTQMMIYALAWYKLHGEIPTTTLIFIESNLQGSKVFSEKDLQKARSIILDVASGIRQQNFKAMPDARQCSICPYKDICPDSAA